MEFFRPRRIRRQSLVKSAVPAARRAQSPQTMAGSTQLCAAVRRAPRVVRRQWTVPKELNPEIMWNRGT